MPVKDKVVVSALVVVVGNDSIGGPSDDHRPTQDMVMMPPKYHHFDTLQLFPIAADGSATCTHHRNNSNRGVVQLGLVQMALYAAVDAIVASGVVWSPSTRRGLLNGLN